MSTAVIELRTIICYFSSHSPPLCLCRSFSTGEDPLKLLPHTPLHMQADNMSEMECAPTPPPSSPSHLQLSSPTTLFLLVTPQPDLIFHPGPLNPGPVL